VKSILLDQGLALRAAVILREHGFDAVHVSEIGMSSADDLLILERAREDQRACVTLDHDFHAHLAAGRSGGPSVILLRVEGLDAIRQAKLIHSVCAQCAEEIIKGAAISADQHTIRVRRLPLR
jgi:predicted nuclease of predicted toxin-antitoxin system